MERVPRALCAPVVAEIGDPAAPATGIRPLPWATLALYLCVSVITFDQIMEDAFIYFRVAVNIAHGYGYVFNAGGDRIESGSSTTWQYLLALLYWSHIDLVAGAKILGIACGIITLCIVHATARAVIPDSRFRAIPALLLAVSIPFHAWMQRGLETPLYVLSIVLVGYGIAVRRFGAWWYVAIMAVVLSRSEGPMLVAPLLALAWVDRAHRRQYALATLVTIAAVVGVEVFRIVYFHDVVSHPFYIKMIDRWAGPFGLQAFLRTTCAWIVLVPAAVGFWYRWSFSRSVLSLLLLEMPFLAWGTRTHLFEMFNRHLVPALPILFVLCGVGLFSLARRFPRTALPIRVGAVAYAGWLLFFGPAVDASLAPMPNPVQSEIGSLVRDPHAFLSNLAALPFATPRRFVPVGHYLRNSERITDNWQYLVGDFIARTYPRGITVVYDQMGQTPWYAGMDKRFIDTWGLISREPGYAIFDLQRRQRPAWWADRLVDARRTVRTAFGDTDSGLHTLGSAVDYIFGQRPELIILNDFAAYSVGPRGAKIPRTDTIAGQITTDPRLAQRYVARRKWWMTYYERMDISQMINWERQSEHTPGAAALTIPAGTGDSR